MTAQQSTPTAGMSRRGFLLATGAVGLGAVGIGATAAQTDGANGTRTFRVRIENVSDGSALQTTDGGKPVPLSPGVYAVHTRDEPIFSSGAHERDNGLEEIAEDGSPGRLADAIAQRDSVVSSGAFTTPVGGDGPAPLFPGEAYEFEVTGTRGRPTQYLSLVTMFVQSNDLFYALGGPTGMALFDGNAPLAGNVTEHVSLWDAGTEINEEPGVG
ncbi:spondin domain-containing protein [Haloarcula regularis]|nr:spondin domain-containing protein [Halomicroarcula sp. SYNS111]